MPIIIDGDYGVKGWVDPRAHRTSLNWNKYCVRTVGLEDQNDRARKPKAFLLKRFVHLSPCSLHISPVSWSLVLPLLLHASCLSSTMTTVVLPLIFNVTIPAYVWIEFP